MNVYEAAIRPSVFLKDIGPSATKCPLISLSDLGVGFDEGNPLDPRNLFVPCRNSGLFEV